MGEYIKPVNAFKRMGAAKLLRQGVYIYGLSGFGKTEFIRQYFKTQKHIYIPCDQNACNLKLVNENFTGAVIIDNVNAIENKEIRDNILALLNNNKLWVIICGRSKMPSWLFNSFIKKNMMLISENDLALSADEIDRYLRSDEIILEKSEIANLLEYSSGNMFEIKYIAQQILAGEKPRRELYDKTTELIGRYYEEKIMSVLDSELVDCLMKLSIVEEFSEELAVMITGNSAVRILVDRVMDADCFLAYKNEMYSFNPRFRTTLYNMANKFFSSSELKNFSLLAGGYYEAHDEDNKAVLLYVQCKDHGRIRELLLRNSRKCPESAYYGEMKKYYLMLSDDDIKSSIYLMAAMSMLYSILLDFEKSEYWYNLLKLTRDRARGSEYREATRQLAYLDISLPHRGSLRILDIIKSYYALLRDKSITPPEFSVTSNMPSLMNGGKDFCEWSKHDRELAATAGKFIPTFLGKYGKGLVNAALAESFFEKGGDPYEIMSLASKAKLEAEVGGKLELCFAANAVLMRQHIISGNPDAAISLLNSYEKTAKRENLRRLLPTIAAFRCRIALVVGDTATYDEWFKTAPDEIASFISLDRYLYLAKIRCYLSHNELGRAYSLMECLKFYAEQCDRKYICMELSLLTSIVRYRRGNDWKEDFISALRYISEFKFVPIISREGAAIFPLLMEIRDEVKAIADFDHKWFETVYAATGKVARRYPLYLKTDRTAAADISPIDIRILACLAEGLSIQKSAERLNVNYETLRSRIKELYRKLGAKNKTEAIMIAREMKII